VGKDNKKYELLGFLLLFSLTSTIVLSITAIVFAFYYDYFLITFNTVITNLVASGIIGASFSIVFEAFVNNMASLIQIFDYLWILSFLTLVFEIMRVSYYSRREGYLSIFTFLSYGVIIFLFFSSIIEQITGFIYDLFFNNVLIGMSSNFTFFNIYIQHYTLINLIIIVISVFINFIDFDTIKFNSQKKKEMLNDEI